MATNKQPIKNPPPAKPLQPKGPFHFTGINFHLIFILSVIGICFVFYGNTIPNGFSLDDEFVLHNDSTVAKGISGIPQLFKKRYAWDQKGGYGYRPVVKATFAIEYIFFGDSAHWGHFVNILFYAFVCIFMFYFFRKILYDHISDYFLLVAILLFIVHPLHSEVVASLKNRDEMLVFIFGFYCTYAFLKCFESDKIYFQIAWALSGSLSLGLGALCKPDAFIFVPITMLVLYFFSSKGLKAVGISLLSMFIFILLGNRFFVKRVLPHTDYHRTFIFIENPLVGVHWYHKIPLAFSTVWFYLGKLVFPKDLISYYGYDAFNAFPEWTDFSVLAGILIAGALIYILIKNLKNNKPLLFLLLLFGGTLFPYTDIFQVGAGIVAERFRFLPSVAFALLAAYLLFYLFKMPIDKMLMKQQTQFVYPLIIGICVISCVRVFVRNPDWKSHQSLYKHDVTEAPRSAKLQSLLAATYIEDAQKLKAVNPQNKVRLDSLYLAGLKGYAKSVDIYPMYGTSWNNMGMVQYTLYGNLRGAIDDFSKALQVDTAYSEAWFNMGACYEALAEKVHDTVNYLQRDSVNMVKKKGYWDQTAESINNNLSACEMRLNSYRDESEKCYLNTIKLKPAYYLDYIYLTRLYFSEAKYDKVIGVDKHAISMGYESDVVYVTMGNAYLMQQDTTEAVADYEKSIQLYDKNYIISNFLKTYYYKRGDMVKARYYAGKYDTAMMYKNRNNPNR